MRTQREGCVGDGQLLYTVPRDEKTENAGVREPKGGKEKSDEVK